MLSDYNKQTIELKPDPYHQSFFGATAGVPNYDLQLWDNDLIVDTDTGNVAASVITLPYVAQCRGVRYTIHVRDINAAGIVTVQDRDDSEDWTNIILYADGDQVTLESTGIKWIVVGSVITLPL
jgi:hypothetical protein